MSMWSNASEIAIWAGKSGSIARSRDFPSNLTERKHCSCDGFRGSTTHRRPVQAIWESRRSLSAASLSTRSASELRDS